jgi:hypothetical protein
MFTQDSLNTSQKRSLLDGKVFSALEPAGFIPSPHLAGSEPSVTSRGGSSPTMPISAKIQSQVEQKSIITHLSHPSVVPDAHVDGGRKPETPVFPKIQINKVNSTLLSHSKYETAGVSYCLPDIDAHICFIALCGCQAC